MPADTKTKPRVALDDKYDLAQSRVYITGSQAIVRLALMQHARDRKAGLNTAGYISGYRGSPLGGLDQQFWRAQKQLSDAEIVFNSGLNEDLAATATLGQRSRRSCVGKAPIRRRLRRLVRQGTGG